MPLTNTGVYVDLPQTRSTYNTDLKYYTTRYCVKQTCQVLTPETLTNTCTRLTPKFIPSANDWTSSHTYARTVLVTMRKVQLRQTAILLQLMNIRCRLLLFLRRTIVRSLRMRRFSLVQQPALGAYVSQISRCPIKVSEMIMFLCTPPTLEIPAEYDRSLLRTLLNRISLQKTTC